MRLTKEDYMKLGLERCAELLVERDNEVTIPSYPIPNTPWTIGDDCYFGGKCTNPNKDCFNCPRKFITTYTTTSTNILRKEDSV